MTAPRPCVVFICVKNAGKSQMAAALARVYSNGRVIVQSAGTQPGQGLNRASEASVAEVGASFDGEYPKAIDAKLLREANRIIIIGTEAHIEPVEGMTGSIQRWETVEPSRQGIEGQERMRLIRDDIAQRVQALLAELAMD
ncbi:low molecular weight phosphatase family protein [Rothia sp. HC945]|uniref:arsenate-mycothiol transferase ArsC n=1 Tax=Rothia sp. HC945 TaxID=3171170 RepID=UPI003F21328C